MKNNKPINISQTLVVRPPQRSIVGIDKWRTALQWADMGRRAPLVELTNELIDSDPILFESFEKRIRAITNADIIFQKNGSEVEEMADVIDTLEFEKLLREIMLTIAFGKTVIEFDFSNGLKINPIDRRHLNTHTKQILISQFDTTGIPYDQNNDFILNIGDDKNLGLYTKVTPFAIFKRNGGADYAQYCELFGIPQLVGLYDPDDENGRTEMEQSFKKRGGAGNIVMSKNGDIKVLGESASNGNSAHAPFLKWCDEQILIGLCGQTMTTKDGSSYSQGKVHADTEDEINKADRRFVQRVLNEKVLPMLEKRGYPVAGGWFSFPEKEKALNKKDQFEIAKQVHQITNNGIDENYWYEFFGLPKKSKKEPKNQDAEKNKENETNKQTQLNAQKTKAPMSLLTMIKNFFAQAPR